MKMYRVKEEYFDDWSFGESYSDAPISEEEIERLAKEWDKSVEDLMEQVEEIEKPSAKARLQAIQERMHLTQKQLGIYIGVSARTVNSWMGLASSRSCPDHVVELVERLSSHDMQLIEDGERSAPMMRWAVIDSTKTDEFLTVCGSKADAVRQGELEFSQLTAGEKKDRQSFIVGLIKVQLVEDGGKMIFSWYTSPEGWGDGTVYEIAKRYI